MNLEELIAANAPNEGRNETMHPSHSTMEGSMLWIGTPFKGAASLTLDTNTATTHIRLKPDELEQLGAMLIAQARWMRETPAAQ